MIDCDFSLLHSFFPILFCKEFHSFIIPSSDRLTPKFCIFSAPRIHIKYYALQGSSEHKRRSCKIAHFRQQSSASTSRESDDIKLSSYKVDIMLFFIVYVFFRSLLVLLFSFLHGKVYKFWHILISTFILSENSLTVLFFIDAKTTVS